MSASESPYPGEAGQVQRHHSGVSDNAQLGNHSETREAHTRQIHNACRNANDLDMRQAMAVEARIALDLRIGAAFTRFATMNLQARIPELSEQTISYGQLVQYLISLKLIVRAVPISNPRLRGRPV